MQRIHCKTQTASAVQKQNKGKKAKVMMCCFFFFFCSLDRGARAPTHSSSAMLVGPPPPDCSHPRANLQTCLVRLYLKRDDGL